MKYCIVTYGCQMNKSDSERIASLLESCGFKFVSEINKADFVVVNMCSVRQTAVDRIFGIGQNLLILKRRNNKLKTILTGCVTLIDRNKFSKIFDFVLDIRKLTQWPQIIGISQKKDNVKDYLEIVPKYQTKFTALVPISNGCNNFCTYCVVPYTRERLVCRPYKKIIEEVKNLVKKRYKEIWLLGQNVNSYLSKDINFAKLLKLVNDIPGNFWIRFTSPHPKDFSKELIDVMATSKKVTEYLNLPVQSGDNEILRKMNRPYTREKYIKLVKEIRERIPNVFLSTDVIVGFPGETKKQFENTKKIFKEVKYDMAYISEYSPRPGTVSLKMKDGVSHKEKEGRRKILTETLKETALKNNGKFIGKTIEVLVSDKKEKGGRFFYLGKTRDFRTVLFESKYPKSLMGKFVKIKITNADFFRLKGKYGK